METSRQKRSHARAGARAHGHHGDDGHEQDDGQVAAPAKQPLAGRLELLT
jgi:hypothetical protein